MDVDSRTACTRTNHPQGYIELYYTETSQKAVDDLVAHIKDIARESRAVPHTGPAPLRLYINSQGITTAQPVQYLLERLRAEQSYLMIASTCRLAVTFNNRLLAYVVKNFLQAFYRGDVIFCAFNIDEHQQALDWLLSDAD